MKKKTVWLYLDGKKHCDVLEWALGANVTLPDAKSTWLNTTQALLQSSGLSRKEKGIESKNRP